MANLRTTIGVFIELTELSSTPLIRDELRQFVEENEIKAINDFSTIQGFMRMTGVYALADAERIVQWLRENGIKEEPDAATTEENAGGEGSSLPYVDAPPGPFADILAELLPTTDDPKGNIGMIRVKGEPLVVASAKHPIGKMGISCMLLSDSLNEASSPK